MMVGGVEKMSNEKKGMRKEYKWPACRGLSDSAVSEYVLVCGWLCPEFGIFLFKEEEKGIRRNQQRRRSQWQ